MENIDFESIITRVKITSRGGGIEVDLESLGWPDVRMTAYQNSLGGGMLGCISNDCLIRDWEDSEHLADIAKQLRMYYFKKSGQSSEYDQVQSRQLSAY